MHKIMIIEDGKKTKSSISKYKYKGYYSEKCVNKYRLKICYSPIFDEFTFQMLKNNA